MSTHLDTLTREEMLALLRTMMPSPYAVLSARIEVARAKWHTVDALAAAALEPVVPAARALDAATAALRAVSKGDEAEYRRAVKAYDFAAAEYQRVQKHEQILRRTADRAFDRLQRLYDEGRAS